ncbi:MAG: tagatose 1,6-diphosphate aldolase [Solirubrobacteraceae bacterium]|nr:tagatose 1,6-diphosphate aldolase [Solirubrobacteraceae bacterium]
MTVVTPAGARRLDQLGGADGIVVGAAVDHRDSLRTAFAAKGLREPDDAQLTDLKVRVARALAPAATVVLLDAEYGAAQALAAGALPGTTALAIPLEAQGYDDASPRTTFLPGWSAAQAARLGAAACKLLLPYRPGDEEQAATQDEVVRTAVAACRDAGVALVLEPIVPAPGDVVAGARRLAALEPDVLKVQYPGSAEACRELDEACGPSIPWVLLGGGADAAALEQRIVDACSAGASGFIVGRTLWEDALTADPDESQRALETVSLPRLERLAALARECATPWRERVGAVQPPARDWYLA